MNKYKTTPELVKEDLEQEAGKIREAVCYAVYSALMDLEINETAALEKIKKQAENKRKKLKDKIQEFENMADIRIVSKYWDGVHARYFIGDMTKIDGAKNDE